MFCVNCGAKFEGKFCPECGTKAGIADAAVQPSTPSPDIEIKELGYLRGARDCLLALSNAYSNILVEDIKGVQVKHEIDALMEKREALVMEINSLEADYQVKMDELDAEENKQKISVGKVALGVYTCGLSLLATGIHKKKRASEIEAIDTARNLRTGLLERLTNPKKEEIEKLDNLANTLESKFIEEYNKNMSIIKNTVNDILNSQKWLVAKANIPADYMNIDAVPRLIELLAYGRAATWQEACNIYEDELFKSRMLNISERQLAVQEDILSAQQDLIDLNIENINLNRISIELQQAGLSLQEDLIENQNKITSNTETLIAEAIKTNKSHQAMLQEMARIRKNTGATKNAASLSAFVNTWQMFSGTKIKFR